LDEPLCALVEKVLDFEEVLRVGLGAMVCGSVEL
jgi:hypothetical protein